MQKNKNLITLGVVAALVLMLVIVKPAWLTNFIKTIAGLPQQAAVIGPVNPSHAWPLDGTLLPSAGTGDFPGSGTGTFLTGCAVGGCRSQLNNLDAGNGFPATISIGSESDFTIEFIMETGPRFHQTTLFSSTDNAINAKFLIPDSQGGYHPQFVFHTPGNDLYVNVTNNYSIFGSDTNGLNGINQANLSVYATGPHHYVFRYGGGTKSIWFDGTKIAETSISGSVNIGSFTFGDQGDLNQWYHLNGKYDEAAIYEGTVLPDALIREHYENALLPGGSTQSGCSSAPGPGAHYCTTTNYSAALPAPSKTAAIDSEEYDPNYPAPYSTPYVSPLWQLKTFENPRYKTTNSLQPAMIWADLFYAVGYKEPGIDDTTGLPGNVVPFTEELAKTFRYAIPLAAFSSNTERAVYALALQHPEYKTSYTTRHAGTAPLIWTANMNPYMYFRTGTGSTGNRMSYEGAEGNYYAWRPVTAHLTEHDHDGLAQQSQLQNSAAFDVVYNGQSFKTAGRAYDVTNEDREVIFQIQPGSNQLGGCGYNNGVPIPPPCGAYKDPDVVAEKNSGANAALTMYQYLGKQYAQFYDRYFDLYMESGNTASLFNNTIRTSYYTMGGGFDHSAVYNWQYDRESTTSVNGNHYSNKDMFVRSPNLWRTWSGPSHGLGYVEMSTMIETGMTVPETVPGSTCSTCNDQFSMPVVAAGWASSPTDYTYQQKSVRPPQWLGLMKLLAVQGAEAIMPGYYMDGLPPNSPGMNGNSYAWQYAMPSYAQATMSVIDTLYKNSHILSGQNSPTSDFMPMQYVSADKDGTNSLDLATGDPQTIASARKHNTNPIYIIGTAMEKNNNMKYPDNQMAKNISIKLEGSTYKIGSRVQGAVYVLDKTSSSNPVFYQLDKWHDKTHPLYWPDDIAMEAEVVNNTGTPVPHTERSGAPVTDGDFTNYDTYVNPVGPLTYKFQTRAATPGTNTLYLWVRSRNASPSATVTASIAVDGVTKSLTNTNFGSTSYSWCNKDASSLVMSFPGITDNVDHTVTFTGNNANFYFDQFLLTKDATKNPGGNCTVIGTGLSAPQNLTATNVTTNSANLSWNASTGAVAGYNIYNNGGTTAIATTTGTGTTHTLTGLTNNTTYNITIKARDAAGTLSPASNTATFTTTSNPDTVNPTVTITAPVAGGGTYLSPGAAPNLNTMAGTASDNVGVTSVTWTNSLGGSGTATGTTNWTISTLALSAGSNVITVISHDAAGNNSTAATITVIRDTTPPVISITSPTNGQNFPTGTTSIILVGNATDNVGINSVDFYYNGTTLIGGGTSSGGNNYTKTWNPGVSGSIPLKAIAYDTSGNPTTSTTITITIASAPPQDTTPPTVTMTTPTAGATVSGTALTLSANATDPGSPSTGVTKVEFYLDGTLIPGQIDTSPTGTQYDGVWNTTTAINGSHTLTAKAYDGATHITTSSGVTVTVNNGPDVIVTSVTPIGAQAGQSITFSANIKNQGTIATPAGTITGVSFWIDNVAVSCSDGYTASIAPNGTATITAGSTGSTAYCTTTLPASWTATGGTHTLKTWVDDVNRYVELNDSNNELTTSIVVGTGPTLALTSPVNNQSVSQGQQIPMTVNSSGTIYQVKYSHVNWLGVTKNLCSSTSGPAFSCNWSVSSSNPRVMTIFPRGYDQAGNLLVTGSSITVYRNQ